jgi:hypothetical protein
MPTPAQTRRNRLGGLARQHPDSDAVAELRRDNEFARFREHARKIVATWGPPPPEEVAAIAAIFSAGSSHVAAR